MADEADFITLFEEEGDAQTAPVLPPWKIAVIDDDAAVHDGTRFALRDFTLKGRGLELHSARSAAEAKSLLREHPDTAVVLLDVVMETEGAGLDLVEFIRKELKNETVRIILRTGQPGQAPERRIVVDYDINDYKAKTELTADKLYTSLTAALRSYDQLQRLTATRRGLEIIIEAASSFFDLRSLKRLAEGILTQLSSLLAAECAGILVMRERKGDKGLTVLAGSGSYSELAYAGPNGSLQEEIRRLIDATFERAGHEFGARRYLLYIGTGTGREIVVLLDADRELSDTDRSLVEVFCSRLSVAFDNVTLTEELKRANDELEARVERRTNELRRANAFKREILGTVAHDLKNPLGVILGRSEMLLEMIEMDPLPRDAAKSQVEHIRGSASRLTAMVDSLISDAMADAVDINVRSAAVPLRGLVGEVVEANRAAAEAKRQDLAFAAAGDIAVPGDQERLREAVDNLISNAIKYTPIGGKVDVSVEGGGDEATISVRDSGPGLSPEDETRLFVRFQRLSAKPTGGESSTGLGLSIAKRIIDLHNGRISAGNAEGGGAIFTIVLPTRAMDSGP